MLSQMPNNADTEDREEYLAENSHLLSRPIQSDGHAFQQDLAIIHCFFMLLLMALSITGFLLQISTEGPEFIILFTYVIGWGFYPAVLGNLMSQFEL